MASTESPSEPFRGHQSAEFTVAAVLAGTFRPHSTAEQRATGIEATIRITNHPAMSPGCCIGGPRLGFHQQGH